MTAPSDDVIRAVLRHSRHIAMVGASDNAARPSFIVFKYLVERGYRVTPVNPGKAGTSMMGVPFVASLDAIEEPVDMVDVFRASEAIPGVLAEVLALERRPTTFWMQLGVRHAEAAQTARSAGLTVIEDRCPKIEYGRHSGEISWGGINSRLISARRPRLSGTGFQKLSLDRD